MLGVCLSIIGLQEVGMRMRMSHPFGANDESFRVMTFVTNMLASTRCIVACPESGEGLDSKIETALARAAFRNMPDEDVEGAQPRKLYEESLGTFTACAASAVFPHMDGAIAKQLPWDLNFEARQAAAGLAED